MMQDDPTVARLKARLDPEFATDSLLRLNGSKRPLADIRPSRRLRALLPVSVHQRGSPHRAILSAGQ
jgi:hypothetical protein